MQIVSGVEELRQAVKDSRAGGESLALVPTMGNQGWFEYGGRLGFRVQKGWIVDLFANGTLGPQPVGNTIHGGVGLRINY